MAFNYVRPGPAGVSPDKRDEAMEMARPLTPKSERRRSSYGSLEMSLQTARGLCSCSARCILKDGHKRRGLPCWPS